MPIHQALWVKEGEGEASEFFASYLYPVILEEAVDIGHSVQAGFEYTWLPGEVNIAHVVVSGSLTAVLSSYLNWPVENVDILHSAQAGNLVTVLKFYTLWPPENVDILHSVLSGALTQQLFFYLNWPAENVDIVHSVQSGTLA